MPRDASDTHRLDYARPRDERTSKRPGSGGSVTSVLAGIVGFLIAGIGGFYLVVFGFVWLNTLPRDEMSQGIMGSLLALFIALPLGVFAGAFGAMLAARWARRSR
jgi:hypothetical protein